MPLVCLSRATCPGAAVVTAIPLLVAVRSLMLRVIACTGKVERHVRLAAHHPGIVARGNVEHLTRMQLDDFSIGHSRSGATGQHHSNMFDHAFFLPQAFPYVLRPPPTRLISGPPD